MLLSAIRLVLLITFSNFRGNINQVGNHIHVVQWWSMFVLFICHHCHHFRMNLVGISDPYQKNTIMSNLETLNQPCPENSWNLFDEFPAKSWSLQGNPDQIPITYLPCPSKATSSAARWMASTSSTWAKPGRRSRWQHVPWWPPETCESSPAIWLQYAWKTVFFGIHGGLVGFMWDLYGIHGSLMGFIWDVAGKHADFISWG